MGDTLTNNTNDFSQIKRIPYYFGSKEKPLLGWLHIADTKQHAATGVVICPPLAVEYMNSYRSLRYVADYFALAGIPAFRFDYHGTGDSSGIEEDDNRLKDWLWSIEQASKQLLQVTNCNSLGLFGFRMGATLAALATKTLPAEFLITWAALNSGKKFIREVKLLQMTSQIQNKNVDTLLEAGGMGYWPQTVEDISDINLNNITPNAKHVLIIPRDEQISDTNLYDEWESKNLKVTQETYLGSTLMLVDAHLTEVPHDTIKNIVHWASSCSTNATVDNTTPRTQKNETLTQFNFLSKSHKINHAADTTITEKITYYGANEQNIAILTESELSKKSQQPTVIIANSGANHRVGPSRLYVTLARELSLMGFRCLRIDVPGIGESIVANTETENIEYIDSPSSTLTEAIKCLKPSNNNSFIFMGLCSGAYFSFHAALELNNINIAESILINPLTFYWEKGMTEANSPTKEFSIWNWYKEAITSPSSWVKLLKGKIDFKSLFLAIKNRLITKFLPNLKSLTTRQNSTNGNIHKTQLSTDIEKIAEKNIHLQFILSRNDPGYDILMINAKRTINKLRKENKIDIAFIENADHTFSKYQPRCDAITTILQHFKHKLT